MRVFWEDNDGGWNVGRVVDGEGETCLVAFPNKQVLNLPREVLQVRWQYPISDPVAFLKRRLTETPMFAQARSRFVRAVTAQRAACRGMSTLLSSSVELVNYQFNVVQRVLQDPVQRYLLADEVGLGKTVEAGLLIRQYLLDTTTARVLVVVPSPLVSQWRQELSRRFNLADWLDDFLFVVGAEDLATIEEYLPLVGMLVVDEAHHLSRQDAKGSSSLYELLRRHASSIPRLLLLSATPVLSDTVGFLRILHLLDPLVYSLDDAAGFDKRLQSRQLVAEVVAALAPENLLSMEDDLDRLEQAFGDNETLKELIAVLRPIVQAFPSENDEAFLSALGALRAHLTDTYKLHRRILRNRRKTVPWATLQRDGLEPIRYRCRYAAERYQALDELRVYLVNSDLMSQVSRALFGAAVHSQHGHSVALLLENADIGDAQAGALAKRVDELQRQGTEHMARLSALLDAVRSLLKVDGVQVVVFCDRIDVADRVAQALFGALPEGAVQRHAFSLHAEGLPNDEAGDEWRQFLTDPARCRVLVCDARAEEGLNLHGGRKVALHYDLPASPNRIEQRLGRLDRFGVGSPIRSHALVCENDPAELAWLECLNSGLQVFNGSIASLQYLVEDSLGQALEEWLGEGTAALERWCTHLAGPAGWAARERRRIDQQDTLDALGEPDSDAFDDLESVDVEWQSWREAFDGFAVDALLFGRRTEEWTGQLIKNDQVFRLKYLRDMSQQTLLPLPTFISGFLGTIDTETRHSTSRAPLTHAYSFSRKTALSKEGRKRGVRPLRYGDALVESLRNFCNADDRGRVFAMWRHHPAYEAQDASGVDLFFRFDFLIEADLPQDEDDAARVLRRRAEGHLPPQFHSVWINMAGIETLEAPQFAGEAYRNKATPDGQGRDYNLNPRRWQVLQMQGNVPWSIDWSQHCAQASARAHAFVKGHVRVRALIDRSLRGLQLQHMARTVQLASRIKRLVGAPRDAELRDLQAETESHDRLMEAMRLPAVRLDVCGAIFMSATTPFAQ
ncbi:hypothetical protein BH11PSE7_BH11PSE7_20090 [soil metagenome]